MKEAVIRAVAIGGTGEFGWKWSSETGAAQSARLFAYYYDCIEDARKSGFSCKFERPVKAAASARQGESRAGI